MELTQEMADIFTLRLQEARERYGERPFEQAPADVKDILIAGTMLEQATNEIERLKPSKESTVGDISPAIEEMIEDVNLEVDDVKHIILFAQKEAKETFIKELREMSANAAFNGYHDASRNIDLSIERLLNPES